MTAQASRLPQEAAPAAHSSPGGTPTTLPTVGSPPGGAGARTDPAPPSVRTTGTRPARGVLLALSTLAAVVCAAVVTQVFLAGLGLLVEPRFLQWHSAFVHAIELGSAALFVLAIASRGGAGLVALGLAPFVLTGLQYALVHGFDGPARALHAVNAFAIFGVSWTLAARSAAAANAAVEGLGRGAVSAGSRVGLTVAVAAALMVAAAGLLADAGSARAAAGAVASGTADAAGSDLGAQVYAARCSGCHGDRGEGRVGPRLSSNPALADRAFVVGRVTNGRGIMPAFGRVLTAEELYAVVDHVRSSWGNGF